MFPRHATALAALTLVAPLSLAGTAFAGGHEAESGHGQGQGREKKETHSADPPAHGQSQAPPAHANGGKGAEGRRPAGNPAAGKRAERRAAGERKAANERRAAGRPAERKPVPKRSDRPAPETRAPQSTAGKTTICHATGSETNPYNTITVSNNALDAHRAHQDGRDIIPAPAAGCPGGTTGSEGQARAKQGKTTICHATGSATNPYVVITISDSALDAHRAHQDGRDIIPAPAGGCPVTTTTAQASNSQSTSSPLLLGENPLQPAAPGLLGGQPKGAAPPGGVLGAFTESEPEEGAADRRESGADAPAATRLPFTGLELGMVAVLAIAGLLGGVALRRSLERNAG